MADFCYGFVSQGISYVAIVDNYDYNHDGAVDELFKAFDWGKYKVVGAPLSAVYEASDTAPKATFDGVGSMPNGVLVSWSLAVSRDYTVAPVGPFTYSMRIVNSETGAVLAEKSGNFAVLWSLKMG